jgi:hypothetical protein
LTNVCGHGTAKAKQFLSRVIICNIPEVSLTAKQGPVPPKRAGAHTIFEPGSSGEAAHNVTRVNHFSGLAAILRNLFRFLRLGSKAAKTGCSISRGNSNHPS